MPLARRRSAVLPITDNRIRRVSRRLTRRVRRVVPVNLPLAAIAVRTIRRSSTAGPRAQRTIAPPSKAMRRPVVSTRRPTSGAAEVSPPPA